MNWPGFRPEPRGSRRDEYRANINMHPEDFARWEAAREALFAGTGERLSMEVRYIVRGETRWHSLQAICRRDDTGKVIRWTGSATDITERKRGGGRIARDGAQAAPGATPRGDGHVCRRNRARLQQHPSRDPRLWRDGAARRAEGQPPRARPREHHDRRRTRARAGRAPAQPSAAAWSASVCRSTSSGWCARRSSWSRRSCRRA